MGPVQDGRRALRGAVWVAGIVGVGLFLLSLRVEVARGTVPSTPDFVSYACDGSDTVYTFSFGVWSTSEVEVRTITAAGVSTTLTENSDYTVTLPNGDGWLVPGGTITLDAAPASGVTLWISRNLPWTQDSLWDTQSELDLTTLEDDFDKAAVRDMQLLRQVRRALRSPEHETTDMNLPAGWSSSTGSPWWDGDSWGMASTSVPDVAASDLWAGVLTQTSLDGSLDAMGISDDVRAFVEASDANEARYALRASGAVIDPTWPIYGAVPDDGLDDSAAMQAAIDDAAGKTLFLPAGTYDIATDLTLPNRITIEGVGTATILNAADGIAKGLFVESGLERATFRNFRASCEATDVNCFVNSSSTSYWSYCRWEHVDIDKSFYKGLEGLLASCTLIDCQFGESGTAASFWQPVDLRGPSSNKNIFTNRFIACTFRYAVGCSGAVQLETGWDQEFYGCIWEALTTPAIYAKGVLGVTVLGGNFENVQPGGTNNCLVELAADTLLSQGSHLKMLGVKFANTGATPWTAIAYAGTTSSAKIDECWGSMGGGYYVMQAGPLYDESASRTYSLQHNRTVSYGGSANPAWYLGVAADMKDIRCDDIASRSDRSTILSAVKCKVKTIDVDDDASTADYQLDDDAANTTEQVIEIANMIPAYAEVLSVQLRCTETVTGSTTMSVDVGTASGGAQLLTAANTDSANDINTSSAAGAPILAATNAARSVYVNFTPGANWNTLNAGMWAIQVTYIDYGAAYAEKAL